MLVPELTPLQSQVLAGLLAGGSVAAVAREHKVHRATIYNWRHDIPAFSNALGEARQRQAIAIHDAAQDLAARAYETLGALLNSSSDQTRLQAAQSILRAATAGGSFAAAAAESESGPQAMSASLRRTRAIESVLPADRPLLESPIAAAKYPDHIASSDTQTAPQFDTIRHFSTLEGGSTVESGDGGAP